MASEFRLFAIGKQKAGPEAELFERYNERLRPRLIVTELPEGRGSPIEIKRREGESLLAALPPRANLVVLDLGGKIETSEVFAARFSVWRDDPRPLCFMIGGAEGLGRALERALDDPDAFKTMGAAAKAWTEKQAHVVDEITAALAPFLAKILPAVPSFAEEKSA